MPYTQGFEPGIDRDHYDKHVVQRLEFGAITFQQYCDMADHFLGSALNPATTEECERSDGLAPGGVIRTYFKPDPRRHPFLTNLDYFYWRCQQ